MLLVRGRTYGPLPDTHTAPTFSEHAKIDLAAKFWLLAITKVISNFGMAGSALGSATSEVQRISFFVTETACLVRPQMKQIEEHLKTP